MLQFTISSSRLTCSWCTVCFLNTKTQQSVRNGFQIHRHYSSSSLSKHGLMMPDLAEFWKHSTRCESRFKLVFKSAGLGWFRLKSAPMSSQHLSEMAHRISELILVHHHQHHHHKSGISLETGHGKIKQALVPLGFFTKRQYLGLKKNSPNHW